MSWVESVRAADLSQVLKSPWVANLGRTAAAFLIADALADVAGMFWDRFIPEPVSVSSTQRTAALQPTRKTIDQYSSIARRNLFNSKGLIPGESSGGTQAPLDGPPVKTTLPLKLLGTLILQDPNLSIGTIEDQGGNKVYPVRVGDEVPGKIQILQVTAHQVIFLNIAARRKEFVELPRDDIVVAPTPAPSSSSGIVPVGQTHFNIARSELDKQLANMGQLLTQARALPYFQDGKQSGFRITQIVPGSLYSQLGIKENDVIVKSNGESINDPSRVMQMMEDLKTTNHLELTITRSGKEMNMSYDIN